MTKICPITYEPITEGAYSKKGLRLLSPKLTTLNPLDYSTKELIQEARLRADKMSIQGVQPKISAILDLTEEKFKIVDTGGKYILKPQSPIYEQTPENEDVSMRMAACLGIDVPVHGLVRGSEGELTYFIKRFDRKGHSKTVSVEDFAQLSGFDRETKYNFSMEKIIPIIEQYTTFPMLEKAELFLRVVFNYLIGNEDMHLKNYSLISRENKITLAPAYDFINSTIALGNAKEEIALPINGKKNNLKRKDLIEYYGIERLGLNQFIIEKQISKITRCQVQWFKLLEVCFLKDKLKEKYLALLQERLNVLEL